jgi:replicative DNA helicase
MAVSTTTSNPTQTAAFASPRPPAALEGAMPHSLEAEAALLGAMLLAPNEIIGMCLEKIETPELFYHSSHQIIFRELKKLYDARQAVDLITLTQRLHDQNLLAEAGGAAYLGELPTRAPSVANAEHYLNIVREKYLLRQLIAVSSDVVRRALEPQEDVEAWLDEVEREIFRISEQNIASNVKPVREIVKSAVAAVEKLYDQKGALTGLSTGFRDFDRLTSGLHNSEMIVIAARPSMGKTALAMNIAEHVAIEKKQSVGIFSLEMSSEQLVIRMLCSLARINLKNVRDGFLRQEDFGLLTTAASKLMSAPIFIDDSANLSILQLRAKARRMKMQHDIKLFVVDYLQLLHSTSRRAENRQQEIADISGGIKALAKELQVPIIVLSQLNREVERRGGEFKPRLSDLRESGAIEQDADVVGLLVRPEMYEEDEDERRKKEGEAELVIAKQRNGPTGEVKLSFLKEYTRFEDRALNAPDFEGGGG